MDLWSDLQKRQRQPPTCLPALVSREVTCDFESVKIALSVSQGVLLKDIAHHTRSGSSHFSQVCYMVTQFFDRFHLLILVMIFNEVT